MRISDHPKLAITTLVAVFFLALGLSIYLSGTAASGTIQVQSTAVASGTGGSIHVVFVHYYVHSNECNITALYYTTVPCLYHD
jgi:hypothetical protein